MRPSWASASPTGRAERGHGLAAGLLFGLGLAVSGMTNPDKVLNFLDITGRWDPSLGLVMGGALLVSLPGFAWARRGQPDACAAPQYQHVDRRLLTGSSIFFRPAVHSMKLPPGMDAISVTMSKLTRYLRCTRQKR